ncbi:E3 UBIQUITIN-PROTEIN LIGASE LUL4 ISOFORM X1-RELATED [Salix koriyanagi]|uniref:RING-type E3 ubiquitin transferase n=1 Tax=Salix koriyanagi TaxID=2511006 RepID=A0A9Q0P7E2_9ROSI|nr:E3 UBIQUITIN-PROTEIN LIGASE LUL4 ISOFORM X1-RELATED [Salix koriyanagi]
MENVSLNSFEEKPVQRWVPLPAGTEETTAKTTTSTIIKTHNTLLYLPPPAPPQFTNLPLSPTPTILITLTRKTVQYLIRMHHTVLPMIPTGSGYGSCSYRLPPPPPPSNIPFNNNGWGSYNYHQSGFMGPPLQPSTQVRHHNSGLVQPPRYVEHNQAKTIKNAVNVNKASIKVVADENNLGSHLVSFTFDAVVDGSITIFYFAKEGDSCTFVPVYPEIYVPRKIPFEKGVGQKFSQPSGSGIDLGFFELDQLSKPSPGEDIFPLVIFAEASSPSLSTSTSQEPEKPLPPMSTHAQITEAILDKNNEGHFQVKVIKQILWIEGIRYELREIFGIANSDGAGVDETDSGKECIICMTEPKDTAVLPCRHMCLCSGCAKELRSRSDRCPICRQSHTGTYGDQAHPE